jgi:ribosomal protein L37AE/L43A
LAYLIGERLFAPTESCHCIKQFQRLPLSKNKQPQFRNAAGRATVLATTPRIARVPHTAKRPERCPHCGGSNLSRKGTWRKKLEIVQVWRCFACKRTFTPGPQAHALETMVSLQVRKSHLDLLALIARLFELRRTHEAACVIAGILMNVARDLT